MKAFSDIRREARDAFRAITDPAAPAGEAPLTRGSSTDPFDGLPEGIEPWMLAAFAGLTHSSQTGESFDLVPCRMNGEPAVLLAATRQDGRRTHILPLFLAVQPWMKFGPPEGEDTS